MEFELNGATLKFENNNFYRFKAGRWKLTKMSDCKGYNRLSITTNKIIKHYLVHRVVYWLYNRDWNIENPKLTIDHFDRNKINNDISNLRHVTQQENCFNKDAKGYCWDKRVNKYKAQIVLSGKPIYLGYFVQEEDARQAYLTAKLKYHVIEVRV